jgi:D-methionine transport system substrate-binding protein
MKYIVAIFLSLTMASSFAQPKKQINIGTTPGDFAELVNEALGPELERRNYKVKLIQFSDYMTPNIALAEGSLDVNIFQHKPYLDHFKEVKGLKLKEVAQIPTAPLALYAGKKKELANLPLDSTITVAVPNDPTNLARALLILEDLKWIELNKGLNPTTLTTRDIQKNLRPLKIVQLEAAQLPRSRQDADFAIINGNYATLSGLKLTAALYQEKSDLYINWAVVRESDLEQAFVKDIIEALKSTAVIEFSKKRFEGYKFPEAWTK